MTIDERIGKIMRKMEKLSAKHPKFSCGKFPPEWYEPLADKAVKEYELQNQITLPEDYRRFITTVASGGTQPFYGLYCLGEGTQNELKAAVNKKFPYTIRKPLCVAELSDEEYDALFESEELEADAGYVPLCHEGCGMYSILIVNSDDEDTYGTVWFYDLCNDAGVYPLIDPVSRNTMSFLDWLEYYVDKTLGLNDSDYFSYGELAGVIK